MKSGPTRTPEAKGGLLVFAHTPPPFHGQSLMVALMLKAFKETAADAPFQPVYFHVDCRYSDSLKSMGKAGFGKGFLALRYVCQALAIRFRHGVRSLYYVPAPGKHPAFLRDCLVLSLLRLFFDDFIFQWHAAGLSHWLETRAWRIERWMGRKIYRGHLLSIVQLQEMLPEAAYFQPREIRVIPYGIPDPCPDFDARVAAQKCPAGSPVRLLFLSIATREKGIFAAVTTWQLLNEQAADTGTPFYHLTIAGEFPDREEEKEFLQFLQLARSSVYLRSPAAESNGCKVEIVGSVHGRQKFEAYSNADIFLFPSTYPWESFGVVLVEAAYFGLPCITYQPLVGPNGLSPTYHRKVPAGDIKAFVVAVASISLEHAAEIRADAQAKFNLSIYGERMRAACLNLRNPSSPNV